MGSPVVEDGAEAEATAATAAVLRACGPDDQSMMQWTCNLRIGQVNVVSWYY